MPHYMEMHAFLPVVNVAEAVAFYTVMDTAMAPSPMTVHHLVVLNLGDGAITGEADGFGGPVAACAMTEGGRLLGKEPGRMFFAYLTAGTMSRVLGLDPTTLRNPRSIETGESAVIDYLLSAMRGAKDTKRALVETMDSILREALQDAPSMGLPEFIHLTLIEEENPVIAELSRRLPISQRTIERQFKARYGCTPKRFLRHIRLSRASSAASVTLSWDAVPPEIDYCDQSHWLRDMRAIYGATPTEMNARKLAKWRYYPDGVFDPDLALDDWIYDEVQMRIDAYHASRQHLRVLFGQER